MSATIFARGSASRTSSSPARPARSRPASARRRGPGAGAPSSCSSPRRQALGVAGDRLGVDRVRLDARPGVRLVVARPLERRLEVADLDLEPLARPRLAGDRTERLEGVRLLLDLEGRRVARGRAAPRAAPCRRARRAGPRAARSGRRAPARRRAAPRRRRGRRDRCPRAAGAVSASACLSSCSISERPRSRRSISTSRSCVCIRSLRRSHQATNARMNPTPAIAPPSISGARAEVEDPQEVRAANAADREDEPEQRRDPGRSATSGRQVGSGGTSN